MLQEYLASLVCCRGRGSELSFWKTHLEWGGFRSVQKAGYTINYLLWSLTAFETFRWSQLRANTFKNGMIRNFPGV